MKTFKLIFSQPRNLLVLLHDTLMSFFSVIIAFGIRLGLDVFNQPEPIIETSILFSLIAFITFLYSGLYRNVWVYISFSDSINILRIVTIIAILFIPLLFLITRMENVPRSVPVISWFVLVVLLSAPRLIYRFFRDQRFYFLRKENNSFVKILLVGAGDIAEHFIRSTQLDPNNKYTVVGLVTKKKSRVGQLIHGVEVFSLQNDIDSTLDRLSSSNLKPNQIVFARKLSNKNEIHDLLMIAQRRGCILSKLPPTINMMAYDDSNFNLSPIVLEDLLGRVQLSLDREAMYKLINGKRILVTGAGGSIGSELIRQIASSEPSHLSLLDNSEFNLYEIEMEIRDRWPLLSRNPIIADIRHKERIRKVFKSERPEIVFHAAALKHVPMVEQNPIEGISTNAIGTRIVADACLENKVSEMVLISTDKAVNPTNVMGASKRLAELYCQVSDLNQDSTRFITVRFGNVLGSAGSVVPLFKKQISSGGPLTVTHENIERYFMTVGEAVELVLQAAALAPNRREQGAVYVLDMGAPVKIIDLAKQMIRLAGYIPNEDININIIGLRPGEKLSEELFYGSEPPIATDMEGILLAKPRRSSSTNILEELEKLAEVCILQDINKAFAIMNKLFPDLSNLSKKTAKDDDSSYLKLIK